MTPLHWAIEKGFDSIAELLLDHGANPHVMSKFMKTPYSIAKEKGNDFVVNMIEMMPATNSKAAIDNRRVQDEQPPVPDLPKPSSQKRERIHSYDAIDVKRQKTSLNDTKNMTLQLLKEQMSMMSGGADDNLIQSAIQSGRKIMLTEAGKRLLNDSNLNKFLKIPLNTTISSSASGVAGSSKKSTSPRSATVTSRRMSDPSDIVEIFRDSAASGSSGAKKIKPDILNIIRSSSSDLQEVTITQRSKTSPAPSPTQKSSISLSAINVPKVKVQQKPKTPLPSSPDANNVDFRQRTDGEFAQPDVSSRQYSELSNNYNQLKRAFEREQQKTAALQRQMKQLETTFEQFKRQQNLKFESILKLLSGSQRSNDDDDLLDEVEEILWWLTFLLRCSDSDVTKMTNSDIFIRRNNFFLKQTKTRNKFVDSFWIFLLFLDLNGVFHLERIFMKSF